MSIDREVIYVLHEALAVQSLLGSLEDKVHALAEHARRNGLTMTRSAYKALDAEIWAATNNFDALNLRPLREFVVHDKTGQRYFTTPGATGDVSDSDSDSDTGSDSDSNADSDHVEPPHPLGMRHITLELGDLSSLVFEDASGNVIDVADASPADTGAVPVVTGGHDSDDDEKDYGKDDTVIAAVPLWLAPGVTVTQFWPLEDCAAMSTAATLSAASAVLKTLNDEVGRPSEASIAALTAAAAELKTLTEAAVAKFVA